MPDIFLSSRQQAFHPVFWSKHGVSGNYNRPVWTITFQNPHFAGCCQTDFDYAPLFRVSYELLA